MFGEPRTGPGRGEGAAAGQQVTVGPPFHLGREVFRIRAPSPLGRAGRSRPSPSFHMFVCLSTKSSLRRGLGPQGISSLAGQMDVKQVTGEVRGHNRGHCQEGQLEWGGSGEAARLGEEVCACVCMCVCRNSDRNCSSQRKGLCEAAEAGQSITQSGNQKKVIVSGA